MMAVWRLSFWGDGFRMLQSSACRMGMKSDDTTWCFVFAGSAAWLKDIPYSRYPPLILNSILDKVLKAGLV